MGHDSVDVRVHNHISGSQRLVNGEQIRVGIPLVVAIVVVPELSVKVAEQTSPRYDVEWDESWPDEWQETRVVVFEIDGVTYAIGVRTQKNATI